MDINLNLGEWNNVFCIPCSVVDKHLKSASGIYIKVLLIILRNCGIHLTTEQISQSLSVPEDEVKEAIRYWKNSGVFAFGGDENIRISEVTRLSDRPVYASTIEISKLIQEKPEIRFMFERLEDIYGRPVTSTEQRSYIYLHESAGLPADVVVMIAEYCVSIEKTSIRYIQKTALNWADSGIDTHEKAVEHIRMLSETHQMESKIKKAFGIDRNFSTKEKKYIQTWREEYQFDIEMIQAAYDRTIDGIGRLSFPYIDTILKSWHDNHFFSLEMVEKNEPVKKEKQKTSSNGAPSYDISAFEALGYDIPEIELEK